MAWTKFKPKAVLPRPGLAPKAINLAPDRPPLKSTSSLGKVLVALEELIAGQASFYRDLQVVKRNYLENALQQAMVNYSQNRSQDHLDKVSSIIEALNTINTCDSGELTVASQEFSDQLAGKGPKAIKTLPKLDWLNGCGESAFAMK